MPQIVAFKLGGTLEILTEPEGYALLTLRYDAFTITAIAKGDPVMAYTLPVDMLVNIQVAYVDSHGNPAKIDGDVSWASSDETIATVAVDSGDSTTARVTAVGKVGQVQITATADADLGDGTRQIITPMDVSTVAGEAVAGTITPVGEAQPSGEHVEHRK